MSLKQTFSHSKWVLQAILSLAVFRTVQTFSPRFFVTVQNFVLFFKSLQSKFSKNSKNVLKTVIFFLQVGLQAILFRTVL